MEFYKILKIIIIILIYFCVKVSLSNNCGRSPVDRLSQVPWSAPSQHEENCYCRLVCHLKGFSPQCCFVLHQISDPYLILNKYVKFEMNSKSKENIIETKITEELMLISKVIIIIKTFSVPIEKSFLKETDEGSMTDQCWGGCGFMGMFRFGLGKYCGLKGVLFVSNLKLCSNGMVGISGILSYKPCELMCGNVPFCKYGSRCGGCVGCIPASWLKLRELWISSELRFIVNNGGSIYLLGSSSKKGSSSKCLSILDLETLDFFRFLRCRESSWVYTRARPRLHEFCCDLGECLLPKVPLFRDVLWERLLLCLLTIFRFGDNGAKILEKKTDFDVYILKKELESSKFGKLVLKSSKKGINLHGSVNSKIYGATVFLEKFRGKFGNLRKNEKLIIEISLEIYGISKKNKKKGKKKIWNLKKK